MNENYEFYRKLFEHNNKNKAILENIEYAEDIIERENEILEELEQEKEDIKKSKIFFLHKKSLIKKLDEEIAFFEGNIQHFEEYIEQNKKEDILRLIAENKEKIQTIEKENPDFVTVRTSAFDFVREMELEKRILMNHNSDELERKCQAIIDKMNADFRETVAERDEADRMDALRNTSYYQSQYKKYYNLYMGITADTKAKEPSYIDDIVLDFEPGDCGDCPTTSEML